jgi:hypothetical protein
MRGFFPFGKLRVRMTHVCGGGGGLFVEGEDAGEEVCGGEGRGGCRSGVGDGCGCGGGAGDGVAEVGGGYLEAVEQDAGALEIHLVGGDALEHVGDGVLDPGAGFGVLEGEGVVREDVVDVGRLVVEAGVLVAHGVGAAADAFGVDVDALVRSGWLVGELWIE